MRWPALLIGIGIVGLGWLGAPEAQEREKTAVAVEPFEASAGLENVAAQVSDALIARLVAHFTLLTRKDMDTVLAEHRLGFSDGMQSVAQFGKMLGAKKIILGRVDSVASSKAVRICLWMVDVEKASLDFQEVADLVPRERLKEATALLSDVIIAKVPMRGRIVQVQEDWALINLGSTDKLKKGAMLEVLKGSDYGWITVGRLNVVSVDAYSAKTNIARQEEPFDGGQTVQTVVNERQVESLKKKLEAVGTEERHRLERLARQKKQFEQDRLKAEQAEQERLERLAKKKRRLEEERLKAKRAKELPKNRLRFGVGYFEPTDAAFKDNYYEGKELDLGDLEFLSDPSFYSITCYLFSHPYFRWYAKGSYFNRSGPEPANQWEKQDERMIIRANIGARLQIPIGVPLVCITPYVGGGGEYAYLEESGTLERKLSGVGYEYFLGAALVYRRSIGVFVEQISEAVSVGEEKVDLGGKSLMIGVEIWASIP